jgi:hypothetical protein
MANVKISDLTAAAAATSTQQFEVNDSGASKSVTGAQLKSFVLGDITASAAEINILDGATVTTAELNILDGVTATTAELNILDGVTATTAQLNGVSPTLSGTITIAGGTQNWTVTASGTNLTFAYNGTNRMRLDSSGNITVTGNVTAYGTI